MNVVFHQRSQAPWLGRAALRGPRPENNRFRWRFLSGATSDVWERVGVRGRSGYREDLPPRIGHFSYLNPRSVTVPFGLSLKEPFAPRNEREWLCGGMN